VKLLVVVALASSVVVRAEPNPEAEKLFRDGRTLLKDGKLAQACESFAASSHLEPSVGTLLNLGDCRERLGQTASAWGAFIDAGRLARKLSDQRAAEADKRSHVLEATLSYLTITVSAPIAGLAIARNQTPVDPGELAHAVPLDPGSYQITASASGFEPWSATIELAANSDRESVVIPALHAVAVVAPPRAIAIQPVPRMTTTRKLGLGSLAGGGVALGASLVLALQARSLESEARSACPSGMPCRDEGASHTSERAVTRANLATIVGGIGVAALGAGVALWFLGRPAEVAPIATRDSVGVGVTGRF
jgi:hypothetical protein